MSPPDLALVGATVLSLAPEARRGAVERGAEWAGHALADLREERKRGRAVEAWERVVAAIGLLAFVGLPTEDGGQLYVYQTSPSETRDPERPWVARITGTSSQFGLRRQFVQAHRDWSGAKRAVSGVRGVVHAFMLRAGWVVEVSDYEGRRRHLARRYGLVTPEGLVPLTREEVGVWASGQRR